MVEQLKAELKEIKKTRKNILLFLRGVKTLEKSNYSQ
jgi:hypothetical protein